MMNDHEDNDQFKMRLEDPHDVVEERAIPMEINELKFEKISQRVTLISILIPVLIVIVLAITYLDIKKRVTQTEDTGNIEFKKLSNDLESRFSSLSLRQARLEETVEKLNKETNQSNAAIQVRLEKLGDAIKKATGGNVRQKEFEATRADIVKQINEMVSATNENSQQTAAITQTLKDQMDQLNQSMSAIQTNISNVENQISTLKDTKIDKPAMDLALRLETLKIQNEVKAQMEKLQTRIDQLGERRSPSTSKPSSSSPPAQSSHSDTSSAPSAKPAQASGSTSTKIEEQTISK